MTVRRNAGAASSVSRRQFVSLVAAGSAALFATPELAAAAAGSRRKRATTPAETTATPAAAPAPSPSAAQKELERQKTGTLTTLKTLRAVTLPPGGDLPVVFRPQRTRTKGH